MELFMRTTYHQKGSKTKIRHRTFLIILLIIFLYSCNRESKKTVKREVPANSVDQHKEDSIAFFKKYQIKSGTITYENTLNTITIHLSFKTIVYFDDYGMKERRDTYTHDTLDETLMSDGKNMYRIIHKMKRAFKTGKAYHGTESKFGWDEITQEDKDLGKVKKYPNEIIAGKNCEVYYVKVKKVLAIYAGWKDINLLTEIKSPGGSSISKAIKVEEGQLNPGTFLLPKGYSIE